MISAFTKLLDSTLQPAPAEDDRKAADNAAQAAPPAFFPSTFPQQAGRNGHAVKIPERVILCGVAVDPLTMGETIKVVEHALDANCSLAVGVVNVAKLVNMRNNRLLCQSVVNSDLVLADGAPLVWLSRLKRKPLPERVAGIDLMFELLALADRRRFHVYFLGARRDTLEKVVEVAARRYPNMVICGFRDGYFSEAQEREVASAVRQSHPHMLFVAMTSPKKEIFMSRWGDYMAVPVCHGVGGSFDVMAGVTRRAPRWVQRIGMEWFFRVLQEPRRMWKRYLVTNTLFVGLALRDLFAPMKSPSPEPAVRS